MIRILLVSSVVFAACGSQGPPAKAVGNTASAPAPPARNAQRVLLVSNDNLFLEGALLVFANVELKKLAPADYELDPRVAATVDVVIFDDFTPTALPAPPAHLLLFDPGGPTSPIAIRSELRSARVTRVDEQHPVMRWVTLADVNIDKSSVFAPDAARGESAIASSGEDAIIAAKRSGRRKIVAFGFSLSETDLPLRVAFPTLLANTLAWFAAD